MKSYIFDGSANTGATGWTYDQLQQKRKIAEQLAGRMGTPRNVGEGLNAIGDALLIRGINKRAEREEQRMRQEADALWGQVSGGGDLDALTAAAGNPFIANNPGRSAVIGALIDRQLNPPKPPERKTVTIGGIPYYVDTEEPVIPGVGMEADPLEELRREAERLKLQGQIDELSGNSEPEPDFKGEADLRGEYSGDQGVKEFRDQEAAFRRVQASAERASAEPSPAADIALIFNYMKVLDPGSTVREGEFATAAQAGSFGQQIQALVTKLQQGEILTPEQRQDFVNRAGRLYVAGRDQYRQTRDDFRSVAGAQGLDIDRAVPNYEPSAPLTSRRPPQRSASASRASGALTTPQVVASPEQEAPQNDDYNTAPIADLKKLTDAQLRALSDEEFEIVRQRIIDDAVGGGQ